jgi:hypothetical protein
MLCALLLMLIAYLAPLLAIAALVLTQVCGGIRTGGGDDSSPARTYLYIGDQIDKSVIAARLPGWQEVAIETRPKYVDFVIATGKELSDKRLFDIRGTLKCRLDSRQLTDKVNFHHYMEDIAPELIARTIDVDENTELPSGVWMIRANWGWGGRAAAVATNTDELREICKRFEADNPYRARGKIIASEYIADPMLVDGYKFHLRIYMLCVCLADGTQTLTMLRTGLVIPAHEKYQRGDWSNADIHDTHGRDNRGLMLFPRDFGGDEMFDKVVDALKRSVVPLLPKVRLYPESTNAYEMLGADIMFTADGQLKIIEINDTPGLTWLSAHPEGKKVEGEVLDLVFRSAVDPVFGLSSAAEADPTLFISLT